MHGLQTFPKNNFEFEIEIDTEFRILNCVKITKST